MLIRNFQGKTIQDALDQVRKEFGNEAVIMKTDIIRENGTRLFCVTAATDQRVTMSPTTNTKSEVTDAVAARNHSGQINRTAQAPNHLEAAILDVLMPELLKGEIKKYYLALRANEVESELAKSLCSKLQQLPRADRSSVATLLESCFGQPAPAFEDSRTVVLVGPSGSGKSSLLAKIATDMVFNQHRAVTLSTLDNFRPGAEGEITSLTEILDIVSESRKDGVSRTDTTLKLIDTTAIAPEDAAGLATLQDELHRLARPYVVLVLSATVSWKNNRRVIEWIAPIGVDAIAFTQVDLAVSCGSILNVAALNFAPLLGVTDTRSATGLIQSFEVRKHLDRLIGDSDE